ncbi:hypothetical protein BGZ81_002601 [Podila clonocystis]|nr:hypothetical protein BGZ81_002601 [Podila clonocystis]
MPPSTFLGESSSDESPDLVEFDPNTPDTQSTQSTTASNSQIPKSQTYQQSFSEELSSSSSSSHHMLQNMFQTQKSFHATYFETSSSSSSSAISTSTTSSIPPSQPPIPPRVSITTRSSKKMSSSRSCRFCDKRFSRSNNRAKHELYIHCHGVPAEYSCIWKRCLKPFKRKGDLGRHIREHHLGLHYRFECRCPSRQDESLHSSNGSSSNSSSSSRSPSIDTGRGRSRSRVPSGEPLFYKREAGSAARLCGCDPQGAPVYPWHSNADPLRRRAWDWDEIYENWSMIQWAGLHPELFWELELLVIQELARIVPVAVEDDDDDEVPV